MGAREVNRKLAAILAADVVGYSRLMGEDEAGTHARLKALRKDFIAPTIAAYRGRIVKLAGDGALVEFASVVDAVQCAVDTQQGIAQRNTNLPPEHRIEFRVGINLGDVIIDDEDIYGDGVNVAARLEGLAPPGGICISDVVHQIVRGRLNLAFADLGEQRLKNIPQQVRVWCWINEALEKRIARNSEADDLYMQGYEALRHKSREDIYHAREFFDRAIARAPDFAVAYGRLAHTYFCEWNFGWTDDSAVLDRAIQLGEMAVDLNRLTRQPEPHEDLALVYAYARRWDEAREQAERAIELNPNYAKGYARLAEVLTLAGNPEAAPILVEKARRLEPHYWDHFYKWVLGSALFAMTRPAEAISALERSLRGDPQFFPAHVHLAAAYAEMDDLKAAHRAVAEVLKISPDLSLAAFKRRKLFGYKDESVWRRLLNGLGRAGLVGAASSRAAHSCSARRRQ